MYLSETRRSIFEPSRVLAAVHVAVDRCLEFHPRRQHAAGDSSVDFDKPRIRIRLSSLRAEGEKMKCDTVPHLGAKQKRQHDLRVPERYATNTVYRWQRKLLFLANKTGKRHKIDVQQINLKNTPARNLGTVERLP